jgi:hypothetical protein
MMPESVVVVADEIVLVSLVAETAPESVVAEVIALLDVSVEEIVAESLDELVVDKIRDSIVEIVPESDVEVLTTTVFLG